MRAIDGDPSWYSSEYLLLQSIAFFISGNSLPHILTRAATVDHEQSFMIYGGDTGSNVDKIYKYNQENGLWIEEAATLSERKRLLTAIKVKKSRLIFPSCTECTDSNHKAPECSECINLGQVFPNCSTCINSLLQPPHCVECIDSRHAFPNCSTCINSHQQFPDCQQCIHPYAIFPNCTQCKLTFGASKDYRARLKGCPQVV